MMTLSQHRLPSGQEGNIVIDITEDHLSVDGLFPSLSLSCEAGKPIMEVIDEAVEESAVCGVLVGPYDLVRRHRDHDGRPAGAGIRNDPLARMGGCAGPDRVRALSQFRTARRRRG